MHSRQPQQQRQQQAPNPGGKQKVQIFVQPGERSTAVLTNHIGKYIDSINQFLIIDIIQVTNKNLAMVKKMGISRTPTLIYKGKQYVSLEKIQQILTPPREAKDSYGVDGTSSDDLIQRYQDSIIHGATDDEVNDADEDLRQEDIHRKIAQFQKRRPSMEGMENDKRYVKGGRKVTARQGVKNSFNNDDDFRQASHVDEITETGVQETYTESGDEILENYYNDEADRAGRKPNRKPIRWSKT